MSAASTGRLIDEPAANLGLGEAGLRIPKEFLGAALRCGRLGVQLLQTEMDEIGIALMHNMISPELAVEWLYEIDALRFVTVPAEGTT